jgi:pimeloyl-ACP methyl ester carboxylesterase
MPTAGAREFDTEIDVGGVRLPATCTLPDGPVVGGLVTLHGATAPERDFFLYPHLATAAAEDGWAVLRYDRRPIARGTVPFDVQAADALAVAQHLRRLTERPALPVGLWGVSQGAWSATVAAARSDAVAFLVLVGFSAISPGRQMRFYTAGQLREHGYGDAEQAELASLRDAFERYLRGELDHAAAQARIDAVSDAPWFDHAWVPAQLPPLETVAFPGLFDFDPTGPLREARCPLLAIWGAEDAEVPAEQGRQIVAHERAGLPVETRCEVLDGVGHTLTVGDAYDPDALHPGYVPMLRDWLAARA